MPPRPHKGRKLLVASIGVATLHYAGVGCGGTRSSGPFEPPPHDASAEAESGGGNFGADGAATGDAGANDASHDAVEELPVANLAAP